VLFNFGAASGFRSTRALLGYWRETDGKIVFITVVVLSIAGCAVAAKVRARNEMESSKAAYTECLKRESDLSKCEGLERAFEADLKAFRATSGALQDSDTIVIEKE
jgi:hypothetical protein